MPDESPFDPAGRTALWDDGWAMVQDGFTETAPDLWSWRGLMQKASPGFDRVESADVHGAFRGSMIHRTVGEVMLDLVEIGDAPAHSVTRTAANIQGADSPLVVGALFEGDCRVRSGEREAHIHGGDLVLIDAALPYEWRFDGAYRALMLRMPRASLGVNQALVGRLGAVRMTNDDGVGALAYVVLEALADHLDLVEGPFGRRVLQNVLDLVGSAFSDQFASLSQQVSRRDQLLARIIDYLEPRLAEPDLSPQRIAEENFISTRHLHSLFRSEGTTVSAWIRSRRLENARRMLGDPALRGERVHTLALRSGFDNAAHFSKLFRAAFGESPREWRTRKLLGDS